MPALAIFFFVWRERRVRRIRRESSVAHAHRGWFESRPFTVPNEKPSIRYGNYRRILPRGNKSQNLRFRRFSIFHRGPTTARFFRKRHHRNRIAVCIRDIQRFFVFAKRHAFGTRSGKGIFRQARVNPFDLLI